MSSKKTQATLSSFFSPKPGGGSGAVGGESRKAVSPFVTTPLEKSSKSIASSSTPTPLFTASQVSTTPLRTNAITNKSNVASSSPAVLSSKKRKVSDDDEDPAAPVVASRKKKKKLKRVQLDSDSDLDYDCSSQDDTEITGSDVTDKLSQFESSQESIKGSVSPSTPKPRKQKSTVSTPARSSPLNSPTIVNSSSKLTESGESDKFKHLGFQHLHPSKIKDKKLRSPDHADYDPTTLHVPREFLESQTPGHQQWWLFKADHYDSILFFKVGKFYELYHMDAVTCVTELGLTYMRGDYAHAGFPEIGFSKFADLLVQKGYKVARVEQTETPDEMQARVSKMNKAGKKVYKYDKVVAREICQVTTKATQLANSIESGCLTISANFLLALVENEGEFGCSQYGACFVDTKVGVFYLSQFTDDRFSSALRVFFAHTNPVELIYIKGQLSAKTQHVIKSMLPSARKNAFRNESEFYSSMKTMRKLQEGGYFESGNWPDLLKQITDSESGFSDHVNPDFELAVNALGGCLFKLQQCLIDHDVISMGQFEKYSPVMRFSQNSSSDFGFDDKMILDSSTVANLGILDNFGNKSCTLLNALDTCVTPFGKRLLKQIVCSPPCHPGMINRRLDAVTWLMHNKDFVEKIKARLRKMPDLEHLLCRIHSLGVNRKGIDHPDSRANMFEAGTYRKRNVIDFVSAISGLKKCVACCDMFTKSDCESDLLKDLMYNETSSGTFPDLFEFVNKFDTAFDHEEACQTGEIKPKPGLVAPYDSALSELDNIKRDSEQFIRDQCKVMKDNRLQWSTSKMSHFQLEVPENIVSRVPDEFQFVSKRKGWERFQSAQTLEFLTRWNNAELQREQALKDVARLIFNDFDQHKSKCKKAVSAIAFLDVLIALSEFSRTADPVMCRPKLIESPQPFVNIKNGKHPCLEQVLSGGYIPNDMILGQPDDSGNSANLVLVTGPNMGGKSTLMRQTGLLIVLAQIGCYIPAEEAEFSPVDRIFTRLGASDRILCGESTFFIEMSETCAILNYATRHSLVLLDELGRGTSTYDGTAIANAVVSRLANDITCRTLFSTHYHLLVADFRSNPRVMLGHMACIESEDEENPGEQRLTFLYKFQSGSCPKSYGFNAARMAGLPASLIKSAQEQAFSLEKAFNQRQRVIELANKLKSVRL